MMNNKVSVRRCNSYDPDLIRAVIEEIYPLTGGPDVKGKKVLLKPNILTDDDPGKAISTHPAVVEAMVGFLRAKGAEMVFIGDSPAVHTKAFNGEKSGIREVCSKTGAVWADFLDKPSERIIGRRKIKIASVAEEADLIISLPKFKNHELVYFTGAIKNTLGLVPGFVKAKQHAIHQDRNSFAEFLVDLNETIIPSWFLMDGITAMEGPGPGRGIPYHAGLLLGSTNPLALDIIASEAAGYNPVLIPTNKTALERKTWLSSLYDVEYDGPERNSIKLENFTKIPLSSNGNISWQFVRNRIHFLRKTERRPVFLQEKCTACHKCIKICPVNAISPDSTNPNRILLTDSKCIRCFCCSEVCQDDAIEIRIKLFGR